MKAGPRCISRSTRGTVNTDEPCRGELRATWSRGREGGGLQGRRKGMGGGGGAEAGREELALEQANRQVNQLVKGHRSKTLILDDLDTRQSSRKTRRSHSIAVILVRFFRFFVFCSPRK